MKIIGSNVNFYTKSINRYLKKNNSNTLNTLADFIYIEKVDIIITTN